jgi:putative RNA 2'-phosphotransferase
MSETSKYLSYILRHAPQSIGLQLDKGGWADIDALLAAAASKGRKLSRAALLQVVAEDDKRRFTLSDDGQRIRAAQGHSIDVELGLTPKAPPAILFHGTAERFLSSILAEGLRPGQRQKVHLSADIETAVKVGRRHGRPVVLEIDAAGLHGAGHPFWLAENGVWLTDRVPPDRLTRIPVKES